MKIEHHDNQNYIAVTYVGRIDESTYRSLAMKGNSLLKEYSKHLLWHFEDTVLDVNLAKLYATQVQISGTKHPSMRNFKMAAIVSRNELDKWLFIEYVNDELGYLRKVFLNEPHAINWLTAPTPL